MPSLRKGGHLKLFKQVLCTVGAAVALAAFAAPASAGPIYTFSCITDNAPGDCTIAEAQLHGGHRRRGRPRLVPVHNAVGDAMSITDIYFDDDSLLGAFIITDSGPGVAFSRSRAGKPPGRQLRRWPVVTSAGLVGGFRPAGRPEWRQRHERVGQIPVQPARSATPTQRPHGPGDRRSARRASRSGVREWCQRVVDQQRRPCPRAGHAAPAWGRPDRSGLAPSP